VDKAIEINDLDVGYIDSNPVVSDLNLKIEKGQVVCLIGANGSGKSTILKTIVRQIKKLDGSIKISNIDEDTLSEDEVSKLISMVMTERIHPELMTCFDVVATGRYPYTGRFGTLSEDDIRIVNQAIKKLGIEEISSKAFAKISDGQRQRVMIARAICQETDIMVLDEPTSFLDIQFKVDILRAIKELAREKDVAVIMSIHELEFVPAIGDHILAISGGKVFKAGTPEDIITGPNIEEMYKMDAGMGQVIVEGLWQYAASYERLICQK